MKEARQREHTIRFHLHEILESVNYNDKKKIPGWPGNGLGHGGMGDRNDNGTGGNLLGLWIGSLS